MKKLNVDLRDVADKPGKLKHKKMISVDLSGYHIFEDIEDFDEEEEEANQEEANQESNNADKNKTRMSHTKNFSVDLRGFDLFYSDSEEEEEEDFEEIPNMAVKIADNKPAAKPAGMSPEDMKSKAQSTFKKAQNAYLTQENEDEDLKGFHLFDEYESDDEDAIKLSDMTNDQLVSLLRSMIIENTVFRDANTRARERLERAKQKNQTIIKEYAQSKIELAVSLSAEIDRLRSLL